MSDKSRTGRYFEDFRVGERLVHPTPRTLTEGDRSLYVGLTGSRDPVSSAVTVSAALGFSRAPLEAFFLFNVAFGKTVPDISLNAIANLGYADLRFLRPVYSGDTLRVESEILGLRETSNRKSGVVYTRSNAFNQGGDPVLTWVRWVLVRKRDPAASVPAAVTPTLSGRVAPADLILPALPGDLAPLLAATGCGDCWEDYEVGERIDHPSAMTVNDSDHSTATRLYQNTAKVHFDAVQMRATPAGKRLVYGGHVISLCRSLAYDGLENTFAVLAINGGTHVAPTYAGDTLCCATQVLERIDLGHPLMGALRLRMLGAKDLECSPAIEFPAPSSPDAKYHASIVLDLDYTVAIAKRHRSSH